MSYAQEKTNVTNAINAILARQGDSFNRVEILNLVTLLNAKSQDQIIKSVLLSFMGTLKFEAQVPVTREELLDFIDTVNTTTCEKISKIALLASHNRVITAFHLLLKKLDESSDLTEDDFYSTFKVE